MLDFLKRPTGKLIVAAILAVILIVITLALPAPRWVREDSVGWLFVRFLALVIAVLFALLTYTRGKWDEARDQLRKEVEAVRNRDNEALRNLGYSGVDIFIIEAPFITWLIWWVVSLQVGITFYIAKWCEHGF